MHFFHCLFLHPPCAIRNQITSFIKYFLNRLLLNQSLCLYCGSRLHDLCMGHSPTLPTPVTTIMLYGSATWQCTSDPIIPGSSEWNPSTQVWPHCPWSSYIPPPPFSHSLHSSQIKCLHFLKTLPPPLSFPSTWNT